MITLEGITISVIALSPTLGAAVASLLNHTGGADVCLHSLVTNECDASDILLTTVDHFAAHLDFFLPRKGKVALLYTGRSNETPNQICSVFLDDEPERMFSRLHALAKPKESITSGNHTLTIRELDVLKEIAAGKTNKEIADSLNISVNTVITHRKNVSQKLGIRSASGLSVYALMNGLI